MKLSGLPLILSVVFAIILSVVFATPALSGPGDPRLIQGKLEWPTALTGTERFIVLRGNDGHAYYVDMIAAQVYVQEALAAGRTTALFGLEGSKPHEIVAVALGGGETLAPSLAQGASTRSLTELPVQQPPTRPGEGYWHYCDSARRYYPTIAHCPEPWILVPPSWPAGR
jgi:hypothetical protein